MSGSKVGDDNESSGVGAGVLSAEVLPRGVKISPGSERLLFFFDLLLPVPLLLFLSLERDLWLLLLLGDCLFVSLRGRDADSEGDRATFRLESSRSSRLDLDLPLSSVPFRLASLLDSPFRFDERPSLLLSSDFLLSNVKNFDLFFSSYPDLLLLERH